MNIDNNNNNRRKIEKGIKITVKNDIYNDRNEEEKEKEKKKEIPIKTNENTMKIKEKFRKNHNFSSLNNEIEIYIPEKKVN